MEDYLKKFRDRLRIMIILYTFCDPLEDKTSGKYGVFRSEIKIQALDFLLRYPDFLSMELMDLLDNNRSNDKERIGKIIEAIYLDNEPEMRVEEMEKFFHGAYESIDDVIAYLVSVGLITHESKKRTDGKTYDKIYYITFEGSNKIIRFLNDISAVGWYYDRCMLIKEYFGSFSGTELKSRQYRYGEYSNISYRCHIQNINSKVKLAFFQRFNKSL
jgi:DNA-binding PadR family transcriptional regulator